MAPVWYKCKFLYNVNDVKNTCEVKDKAIETREQ